MIDLIEWGRNGGEGKSERVRVFRTVHELSEYSRETGKIYRNNFKEDSEEGGVILRHLLRRLFSPKRVPDNRRSTDSRS